MGSQTMKRHLKRRNSSRKSLKQASKLLKEESLVIDQNQVKYPNEDDMQPGEFEGSNGEED